MKRMDGNYSLYIVRGSLELSLGRLASFSPNYSRAFIVRLAPVVEGVNLWLVVSCWCLDLS
jgi:hypothetical protein